MRSEVGELVKVVVGMVKDEAGEWWSGGEGVKVGGICAPARGLSDSVSHTRQGEEYMLVCVVARDIVPYEPSSDNPRAVQRPG